MAYTYQIEESALDPEQYKKFFADYYPNRLLHIERLIANGRCKYFVTARLGRGLVGCMGVDKRSDDFYLYKYLVVHPSHRQKKIATNIITQSVDLLKNMGARTIRNHKRENVIPAALFTNLGFVLVDHKEEQTYAWLYELNVT